ncbi:unnamed protein product [Linum trigynum]|uniref:Uncharacterized protein n=1 Tax=Linum trigynum TaxID=586398 RepID=A0AAV2FUL5_9ROSI
MKNKKPYPTSHQSPIQIHFSTFSILLLHLPPRIHFSTFPIHSLLHVAARGATIDRDRGAAIDITISPPLILSSPYMSGVAGKDGQRRRHHRLAIAYLPPQILLFPPPCMSDSSFSSPLHVGSSGVKMIADVAIAIAMVVAVAIAMAIVVSEIGEERTRKKWKRQNEGLGIILLRVGGIWAREVGGLELGLWALEILGPCPVSG